MLSVDNILILLSRTQSYQFCFPVSPGFQIISRPPTDGTPFAQKNRVCWWKKRWRRRRYKCRVSAVLSIQSQLNGKTNSRVQLVSAAITASFNQWIIEGKLHISTEHTCSNTCYGWYSWRERLEMGTGQNSPVWSALCPASVCTAWWRERRYLLWQPERM